MERMQWLKLLKRFGLVLMMSLVLALSGCGGVTENTTDENGENVEEEVEEGGENLEEEVEEGGEDVEEEVEEGGENLEEEVEEGDEEE